MVLHRCRLDFLETKLGAVHGYSTKTIYVRMLRRIGTFPDESRMANICRLCSKFNDTLNDSAAKVNHHILTITLCRNYEHFDKSSKLSARGKQEFWLEIYELLDRFDSNNIKLLPNPKNPPGMQKFYKKGKCRSGQHSQFKDWQHNGSTSSSSRFVYY